MLTPQSVGYRHTTVNRASRPDFCVNHFREAYEKINYIVRSNYDEDATFGTLPKTSRKGYTFAGWYSKPGAKGSKIKTSTEVEESRVVFARWLSQNDRLRKITMTSGRWAIKFLPYKRTSKILVPCARPRTTIRFYKAQHDAKLYVKVGSGAWKRINKITLTATRHAKNVYAKVIAQDGRHMRTYKVIVVDP